MFSFRQSKSLRARTQNPTRHRRLAFEQFEPRRLLATADDASYSIEANTPLNVDLGGTYNASWPGEEWACFNWVWHNEEPDLTGGGWFVGPYTQVDDEGVEHYGWNECVEQGTQPVTRYANAGIISGPSNGQIASNVQIGESLVYQPHYNFVGTDYFTFAIEDDQGAGTATIEILVTSQGGQAPDATDDTYRIAVNSTLQISGSGVLANDTDPEGGITVEILVDPSHGEVSLNADGSFTYEPFADYTGWDSFQYDATDGFLRDTATVWIKISDTPVAANDSYFVAQGTPFTSAVGLLQNDSDPNNDVLRVVEFTPPQQASIDWVNEFTGRFGATFQPEFTGNACTTYRAADDTSASEQASACFNVLPVNSALIAENNGYDSMGGQTVSVLTGGILENDCQSCPSGTPLTAVLVSQPNYGWVTLSEDGTFVYVPNTGYFPNDSFTYRFHTGQYFSTLAKVTISNISVGPQIVVNNFYGDGNDLKVQYTVLSANGQPVDPFIIGIYASSNGVTPEQLLQFAPGNTSQGVHTLTITPHFTDLQKDYYLIAKADSGNQIAEEFEADNTRKLSAGSFFVHQDDGQTVLHVHGDDNDNLITVGKESVRGWYLWSTQTAVPASGALEWWDATGNGLITMLDFYATGGGAIPTWSNGFDVDADGVIAPADAIIVIDRYNALGEFHLLGTPQAGDRRVDVTGDLVLSVLDIEVLIDKLNGGPGTYEPRGSLLIPWYLAMGQSFLGNVDIDQVHIRMHKGNDQSGYGEGGWDHGVPTWFFGGEGSDGFIGSRKNDLLEGGPGNDALWGDSGHDEIFGGPGDDRLYGDYYGPEYSFDPHGNDILYGGDGNDELEGHGGNDQLLGELGNDALAGYQGDDYLSGGAGIDTLMGNEDSDQLDGGPDADILFGDPLNSPGANDTLSGGEGNDVLYGAAGDDIIFGGKGNDRIYGNEGQDLLIGNDGTTLVPIQPGGEGEPPAGEPPGPEGEPPGECNFDDDDDIDGGAGADSIWGECGVDEIVPDEADTVDDYNTFPTSFEPCGTGNTPDDVFIPWPDGISEGMTFSRPLGGSLGGHPTGSQHFVRYPFDLNVQVDLLSAVGSDAASLASDVGGQNSFTVHIPGGFESPEDPYPPIMTIPTLIDDLLETTEKFYYRLTILESTSYCTSTHQVNILDTTIVAKDDKVQVLRDTPKTIRVTQNDKVRSGSNIVPPPESAIESFTQPEHGQVDWYSGLSLDRLIYTPNPGYVGDDSFDYTVKWGSEHAYDYSRSTATVNLSVGASVNVENAPAVDESDSDQNPATARFRVWLSEALTHPAYVDFYTIDQEPPLEGTPEERARADSFHDYSFLSQRLVFAPGQTSHYVEVPVLNDNVDEYDERFGVALTRPIGVSSGQMTATGTIIDRDEAPELSIHDITVAEPTSGDTTLAIDVVLSKPSQRVINLNFVTQPAADPGPEDEWEPASTDDYSAEPGDVELPLDKRVLHVTIHSDDDVEAPEVFKVKLTSVEHETIDQDTAQVTILDVDSNVTSGPSTTVHPAASDGIQYVSADLPVAVYVATVVVDSQATNPAQRYASNGSEVTWYVTRDDVTTTTATTTSGGFTILSLPVSPIAGSTYIVAAKLTGLMQSGSLVSVPAHKIDAANSVVVPGEPARIEATVSQSRLTADSRSTTTVFASVFDAANNPVANGTPIIWEMSGAASVVYGMSTTYNGYAAAIVRAGHLHETNPLVIRSADATLQPSLTTLPIQIALTVDQQFVEANSNQRVHVTATIKDADDNTVPDGTPIRWMTKKGTLISPTDSVVQNGQATATISVADTGVGPSFVIARVLEYVGQTSFEISAPPYTSPKLTITFDKSWVAGDRQNSGTWNWALPNDTTEQIPYWHETTGHILGGRPYTTARVYISNPNVSHVVSIIGSSGPNTVFLDAEGQGQFTIRSTGALTSSQFAVIPIAAEINRNDNPLLSEGQESQGMQKFVAAPYKTGAVGRFFWGAISGEGEGLAGAAGDIVMSFVPVVGVYSDLRDIGKGLCDWAAFGWDDDRVDKFQLAVSAIGVLGEFTGPVDLLIDVIKKVGKAVGTNSTLFKFLRQVFERGIVTRNWSEILPLLPMFSRMIGNDDSMLVVNRIVKGAGEHADVGRALKKLADFESVFGNDMFDFFVHLRRRVGEPIKKQLLEGQIKEVYERFASLSGQAIQEMRLNNLAVNAAEGVAKGKWSADDLQDFLNAKNNPAISQTYNELLQITHVPGTGKWFEKGFADVGNAFEIKQAAKYKDQLTGVSVKMAGKVAGEAATNIDVKTAQHAIQCKARNYAGMTSEKAIKDETDELVKQIEKTIVYASDTLKHGPHFKAAIVFHEPPPPWVMNSIQKFIDDGKLVVLDP